MCFIAAFAGGGASGRARGIAAENEAPLEDVLPLPARAF